MSNFIFFTIIILLIIALIVLIYFLWKDNDSVLIKNQKSTGYKFELSQLDGNHINNFGIRKSANLEKPYSSRSIKKENNDKTSHIVDHKKDKIVQYEKDEERRVVLDVPSSQTKDLEELYYAQIPKIDGSFSDSKLSHKREELSFFLIKSMSNSNQAILEYLNSDYDLQAISMYDAYLEPVCEINNKFISEPKGIKMLQPGLLEKDGSNWLIKEKVKIEFY